MYLTRESPPRVEEVEEEIMFGDCAADIVADNMARAYQEDTDTEAAIQLALSEFKLAK